MIEAVLITKDGFIKQICIEEEMSYLHYPIAPDTKRLLNEMPSNAGSLDAAYYEFYPVAKRGNTIVYVERD